MMGIPRSMLMGLIMVVVWPGFSQAGKETHPKPLIELDMAVYEFGEAFQGEVVQHDFRVFNRGIAPLEIKKVNPG